MAKLAVSVLTPTFNRAHVLHRAYDSLKAQSRRDFEWVVVDDGSMDSTPDLLARWQREADFPITWFRYSNNRGRNAAVNIGKDLISGDYTLILDSDDALLSDALETVAYWRAKTGIDEIPSAYQLVFRCVDETGSIIGEVSSRDGEWLPNSVLRSRSRVARYRLGLAFEMTGVNKTCVVKKENYIELTNSEHCPPSVTHNRVSSRYETIFVNYPIRRYFRNDGISRLSDKMLGSVKMPRGNYLRTQAILSEDIEFFFDRPMVFLNAARKMTKLGLHLGRPLGMQFRDLPDVRARLLWVSGIPVGFVSYCRDCWRRVTAPRADTDISLWESGGPSRERNLSSVAGPRLHISTLVALSVPTLLITVERYLRKPSTVPHEKYRENKFSAAIEFSLGRIYEEEISPPGTDIMSGSVAGHAIDGASRAAWGRVGGVVTELPPSQSRTCAH